MEEYRKMCCNCKYCHVDYYWDDEDYDEYAICECELKDDNINEFDDACDKYEKYIQEPYEEQSTECDNCSNIKTCIENGLLLNVTSLLDSIEHYIPRVGVLCHKRGFR